jgi:hypothetical protein
MLDQDEFKCSVGQPAHFDYSSWIIQCFFPVALELNPGLSVGVTASVLMFCGCVCTTVCCVMLKRKRAKRKKDPFSSTAGSTVVAQQVVVTIDDDCKSLDSTLKEFNPDDFFPELQ